MTLRSRLRRPTATEVAVLASGTSSMGVEILAGRMIAPVFGSTIYTWGSIIGVFLAALSLGYHRGGQRAKTRDQETDLAPPLLWAAVFIAFILLFGESLLQFTAGLPLPPRYASLPAIIILFGPPTYILGLLTPYAAELSRADGTGAASGHVFAIGTAGSIIGAFATTFILIPLLPVSSIGFLLGALLIGASLVILRGQSGPRFVFPGLAAFILVVAVVMEPAATAITGEVQYKTQTPYQQLQVVDRGGVRTLYLDGQPHSAMDLEDPDRHVFTYTRYFHLPFLYTDDIDRVLFIGGGGFTGPKHFVRTYNVTVDVVELDPAVVRVAKQYFNVTESNRLRVHTQGGRQYLQATDETYDLIILDAYKKDKVPFQLTTVEFMQLAEQRLDSDGILFANLISAPRGAGGAFYRAQVRTMEQVFPQVHGFQTSTVNAVQNIEVIASKDPDTVSQDTLRERNQAWDIGIDLSSSITFYDADIATEDALILRDDRAPVDMLLDPLQGQRYLKE